jgi:Bacterial regulatory proteins, lacI family
MGETRDSRIERLRQRGVLASTECIQQLKEAQARQRNAEGKVWTLTDIAIESGVNSRTVARFLNQESNVDETTGDVGGEESDWGDWASPHFVNASQSVNIVGLRRIGKTSLLRYVRWRSLSCGDSNPTEFIQPERQPLIVSLDLQSNLVSTPAGIVEGLRRGIMHQQGKEP